MSDHPKTGTCCLCGGTYRNFGHNAAPFAQGRCCDNCNSMKVLPERLRRAGSPELAQAFERGLVATKDWGVWCEVWGGVIGSHQTWLKVDGKRVEFATREEAEAEARRLMAGPASNPHRKADRYSARRL